MSADAKNRLVVSGVIALVIIVLYCVASSCASLGRTVLVGGGSGTGAIGGSALGPVGTIIGAVVGSVIAYLYAESARANEHADRLEEKLTGTPHTPDPSSGPLVWLVDHWWLILIVYYLWLRRAHLISALTGREPRWDAILRALGFRTHLKPIPKKK